MPTADELEMIVTNRIDKETELMLGLSEGGVIHGRKAKSPEELGAMAEHCGADCISCENVLQD